MAARIVHIAKQKWWPFTATAKVVQFPFCGELPCNPAGELGSPPWGKKFEPDKRLTQALEGAGLSYDFETHCWRTKDGFTAVTDAVLHLVVGSQPCVLSADHEAALVRIARIAEAVGAGIGDRVDEKVKQVVESRDGYKEQLHRANEAIDSLADERDDLQFENDELKKRSGGDYKELLTWIVRAQDAERRLDEIDRDQRLVGGYLVGRETVTMAKPDFDALLERVEQAEVENAGLLPLWKVFAMYILSAVLGIAGSFAISRFFFEVGT